MRNSKSSISKREDVLTFITELQQILRTKNYDLDILTKESDTKDAKYTTKYTMLDLDFDKEDVAEVLLQLTIDKYIETIEDNKGAEFPPFYVFAEVVKTKDIYIKVKIRDKATNKIFCVSFHYPEFPMKTGPYKS